MATLRYMGYRIDSGRIPWKDRTTEKTKESGSRKWQPDSFFVADSVLLLPMLQKCHVPYYEQMQDFTV